MSIKECYFITRVVRSFSVNNNAEQGSCTLRTAALNAKMRSQQKFE